MAPEQNPRVFRFGVYEADLRTGELRKNGLKIRVQEQPFQVLAYLLEHAGDVVTREELRARLWPADTFVDFDHSLNTAINKLREALGDSASNPRFIETLAKRGYRFIAPVQAVEASTPTGASVAPIAPPAAVAATSSVAAPGPASSATRANILDEELDVAPVNRSALRGLFTLAQIMYLIFYLVSLAKLHAVNRIFGAMAARWDWLLLVLLIVSAVLGVPIRLYLLSAVLFDFRKLGQKFRRLFPFLMPLDLLWALAPFLLEDKIGFGLAFAATAALLYMPFSQRTLVRMMYPSY